MSCISKGAAIALRLLAAATVTAPIGCGSRRPLDQQVLSANHLEYIAEAFPADGGSRMFLFYMQPPEHRQLALLVRHRNFTNADFQEIWLDRNPGFGTHTDVQPGSALEVKLIQLLQTATINTNADLQFITHPPSLDHLKWVTKRIQDRKSKW